MAKKKQRKVSRKILKKKKVVKQKLFKKESKAKRKTKTSKSISKAKRKTKTSKSISQVLQHKPSKTKKSKKKSKKKVKVTTKVTKKSPKKKKKVVRKLKEVLSSFTKKKKEYKLISGIRWYERDTGSTQHFTEDIKGLAETFMNASHGNNKDPDLALPEAFERAFINALQKGPFEADEVMIYRYGILIRPRAGGMLPETIKEKISVIAQAIPNCSIHLIKEDGTFSLRVNLGSATKGELAGNVSEALNEYKAKLSEIYSSIFEYFGNTDWFSFWDTEDSMYE